jgi:hypothetical protein
MLSARTLSAVGREALESSSPGFQPSAIPSQLPTRHQTVVVAAPHITSQIKKPGVLVTPGFRAYLVQFAAERHKRKGCGGIFPARPLFLSAEEQPRSAE